MIYVHSAWRNYSEYKNIVRGSNYDQIVCQNVTHGQKTARLCFLQSPTCVRLIIFKPFTQYKNFFKTAFKLHFHIYLWQVDINKNELCIYIHIFLFFFAMRLCWCLCNKHDISTLIHFLLLLYTNKKKCMLSFTYWHKPHHLFDKFIV